MDDFIKANPCFKKCSILIMVADAHGNHNLLDVTVYIFLYGFCTFLRNMKACISVQL